MPPSLNIALGARDFASQLKYSSGSQGESEFTQNVTSDQEKERSDQDDRSKDGDLASVEDPAEIPGDHKFESLMMTEEEERDFETFALASPNIPKRKDLVEGLSREYKFYSQAQQVHRQDNSFTSEARPIDSQALARDQVDQVQGQAQPLLDQAQALAQDQPASQAQFPVLLPQGQGRPLPILAI